MQDNLLLPKLNILEQRMEQLKLLRSEKKCKRLCKDMQQSSELRQFYNKVVIKLIKFINLTKTSKLVTKDLFGTQICFRL
jgi:hypothetical protein